MRVLDVIQGSPEWFEARAGKVTGSKVDDVMAKGKGGGESATRSKYLSQIVAEILTGRPYEGGFKSSSMDRGTLVEPLARAAYEARFAVIETVGFVLHPTNDRVGASPDGLVGADGMVEFKCPDTHTHLGYLRAKEVPAAYKKQMTLEMIVAERAWVDFVSFDDRLGEDLALFRVRYHRDPLLVATMESEIRAFLAEVDETLEDLKKIAEGMKA